jgi:hypothetical protein
MREQVQRRRPKGRLVALLSLRSLFCRCRSLRISLLLSSSCVACVVAVCVGHARICVCACVSLSLRVRARVLGRASGRLPGQAVCQHRQSCPTWSECIRPHHLRALHVQRGRERVHHRHARGSDGTRAVLRRHDPAAGGNGGGTRTRTQTNNADRMQQMQTRYDGRAANQPYSRLLSLTLRSPVCLAAPVVAVV